MKPLACCVALAFWTSFARAETLTLWLTLDEKLTGPAIAWDGSVRVSEGGTVTLREWQFEEDERIDGATWQAATQQSKNSAKPGRFVRRSALGKGLLLEVSAPLSATLTFATKLGAFSLPLADMAKRRDLSFLDGQIRLRSLPGVECVTRGAAAEEEFPSLAALPDGGTAIAYLSWDGKQDRVWLRTGEQAEPLTEPGDYHDPRVAVDGQGSVWCVWAGNDGGQWDLWARQPGRPAIRLTRSPQSDFWPRLTRAQTGDVWVTWQAVADNLHYEIMLAKLGKDGLGPVINVSDDPGDDWEPALCATPDGRIVVAWDTYRNGSFDVYLREFRDGKPLGAVLAVAATAEREAHASVTSDSAGRIWMAWDVSMEDWGKHPSPGGSLHAWRRSEVACLERGKLSRPAQPIMEVTPVPNAKWIEYPVLAVDGDDRLWIIYRFANDVRPVLPPGKGRVAQTHTMWHLFAHCYDGARWSGPILLPGSTGRQDMRLDTALAPDGSLRVAFPGDHRTRLRPAMPVDHDVFLASLRGFGSAMQALQLTGDHQLGTISPAAPDPEQAPLPRDWSSEGKDYRLLLGDTHRHTDISQCNNGGDGSLQDAYRYALDCYQLDWLAISDHDQDILKHRSDRIVRPRQDYAWWRSQKYCDLYTIPDRFVALYGYEHGGSYRDRGGHKNVISDVRGYPVREEDSPEELFRVLANSGCIVIPHQIGDGAARADWDKWSPGFERVAEVFQARGSYEFAECPRAAKILTHGNLLWDALAKGVRIGIIASSDHGQTHIANAGVWAEDFSRKGILEALRARRTLGGTTKVSLQVSINGKPQGEEMALGGAPTLEVKLASPQPISLVQVVRDGEFVYTAKPNANETKFQFADSSLQPGQSAYYYVRAEVGSTDLAWSSPIWVKRKP